MTKVLGYYCIAHNNWYATEGEMRAHVILLQQFSHYVIQCNKFTEEFDFSPIG